VLKNYIILFLLSANLFSQDYEDVVVLKDGTTVYGVIVEQSPGNYIKIKSGRNIFVYQMDEIDVIKKEITDNSSNRLTGESIDKNKTWSIGGGFVTNKNFNIIQITKDFKLTKNFALFLYAGFGNLFGAGITAQSNYNDNGLMFGWSGGMDVNGEASGSFTLAYQWRIPNSYAYFSLGVSSYAYYYTDTYYDYYYDYYYDQTTLESVIMPVLSLDYRF